MTDKEKLKSLIGKDINKYTITKYISSGSFGDVFEAKDRETNQLVALKIPIDNNDRNGQKSILEESKIYKIIASPDNGVCNMKIIKNNDKKIIVMDLLGQSLEYLINKHKKFSLKTIIQLAIQMISISKYIHSHGYIHRDIKPDNFVMGYTDKNKLYCIDFGLAHKYLKKNGEHIEFSDNKRFCGTARYASIAAHSNFEQGRKDDLEAIAYILVYLYKGKLPWQGIKKRDNKERYRLIGKKKMDTSEEELCENMPKEFCIFLKYVKNMNFNEKPHYSSLINMFTKLYQSRNYKNDNLDF